MRKLLEYILRGRKEAIFIALLSLVIPYFGWVGAVIMALVTLRKGAQEGLWVLAAISLPLLILVFQGYSSLLLVLDVLASSVALWLLAVLLRQTIAWSFVLQVTMLMGMVGVIVVYGYVDDVGLWWEDHLTRFFTQANEKYMLTLDASMMKVWVASVSKIATGIVLISIMLNNLFNLLFARWLQAWLYNPGGLARELVVIRMSVWTTVVLLLVVALATLTGMPVFMDVLPVVVLPFFLAGLSLVHALVGMTQAAWMWLVSFYGLLMLFFPYLFVIVVVLAMVDAYWDIRGHLQKTA